jgi:hypothetical protein
MRFYQINPQGNLQTSEVNSYITDLYALPFHFAYRLNPTQKEKNILPVKIRNVRSHLPIQLQFIININNRCQFLCFVIKKFCQMANS